MQFELHLKLKSDATFGRGDGVPGLVNEEIEHDPRTGLPFLRGRALKGLLVEACADILYALSLAPHPHYDDFTEAALFLFGRPGSLHKGSACMHIGSARLPQPVRDAVQASALPTLDILESLTAIRRQTAVDDRTGAPDTGSLRSMRVLLRGTVLIAQLRLETEPSDSLKPYIFSLLAAVTASLRRAGTGRNRGRGRLETALFHQGQPIAYQSQFKV